MTSKRTILTNTEKAFWRDAFQAAAKASAHPRSRSAAKAAQYCADFADHAIEHLRARNGVWSRQ